MAIIQVTNPDTTLQFVDKFNSLSTFVGDVSGLVSGITDVTNPDNLVTAINYVYGLASAGVTTFANPITFQSTITVQGAAVFQNNVTINGSLNFNDVGSVAVTVILDEDDMASNSATALCTQQSIVAYVTSSISAVNAAQLGGLTSSQFLRSDANDIVDNNIYIQFGDGTSGSARLQHLSATNEFNIVPHDGSSFNTANNLTFDGDEDYWKFAGEMRVLGAFTSLGIDDNATSNRIQIENSAITLKTATAIQGALTISSGNLIIPQTATTRVTNNADEFIEFDSVANEVDIYAANVLGIKASNTFVNLYHTGSKKFETTSNGVTVTGNITLSNGVSGELTNGAGEIIRFNGSATNTVNIFVNSTEQFTATTTSVRLNHSGSTKLETASGGVTVTGAITATGDITAFSSDARLKTVVDHDINNRALWIVEHLDGKAYFWNEKSKEVNPASDTESVKFGLIAQEVEQVLPEILGPEVQGFKSLRYEALIPVLINAIKELSRDLEFAKDRISWLESRV